ncbi:MOSC domain-containing protein [Sphingomonas bacterium]|uniref:MOSC domain-containing protein n=1 Tax=Sphingomonas bacterium TaxID=1895847 RepID=UPI0020C67B68|nr:MOSC N-terminal beta barrel domain-containing protein [Sphingomonas bacterium]
MTPPLRLTAITRYPVKSLRGHPLHDAAVERCGIAGDRRWMVIDEAGRFVTRREVPAMALVAVTPLDGGLLLDHPVVGRCEVALPHAASPIVAARVWRDMLDLRLAAPTAGIFLSRALGRIVHLAYQHDVDSRPVDQRFGHADEHVSLADGFPLLIATAASLAALNAQLAVPIEMERFRPNLVVDGGLAWEEDSWRRLRIGAVVLRLAKPCSRCVITTQGALTGEREQGDEPLTTLRAIGRGRPGGVIFGDNVIPETTGTIRVGDPVEIIERG